jgi:hypothetical protein
MIKSMPPLLLATMVLLRPTDELTEPVLALPL